jgi:predicted N-formylglutamate amidohydrolase
MSETRAGGVEPPPLLITCPHANNAVPEGTVLLEKDQKTTHWAYDPGAKEVALAVGHALGVEPFLGDYSRLYVDLNRKYRTPLGDGWRTPDDFITSRCEFSVSGNQSIGEQDYRNRTLIHRGFHEKVYRRLISRLFPDKPPALLDSASATTLSCAIVDIHSCTPYPLTKHKRDFVIGLVGHGKGAPATAFVAKFLEYLRRELMVPEMQRELITSYEHGGGSLRDLFEVDWNRPVRWNEPYDASDRSSSHASIMSTYAEITAPILPYVNMEVRNDWATRTATREILVSAIIHALGQTLREADVREEFARTRFFIPDRLPMIFLAPEEGARGPINKY